jgi:hypothetical protein
LRGSRLLYSSRLLAFFDPSNRAAFLRVSHVFNYPNRHYNIIYYNALLRHNEETKTQ